MNIRKVEGRDQVEIIALIIDFHDESIAEFGSVVDVGFLMGLFDKLKDTSFLIEDDEKVVGLLAGSIVDDLLSGAKTYTEIMWFVRKKDRGCGDILRKWVEKWAKDQGMTRMMMVHMCSKKDDNENYTRRLTRYYKSMGYRPMEVHFIKEL